MKNQSQYAADLLHYFTGEEAAAKAKQAIDRYFYDEPFTGAWFERLANTSNPNVITAEDIVAVSMLGVTIPPNVVIWLLSDDGQEQVSNLLGKVPADQDIWNASDDLPEVGPLSELWWLLREACWPAFTKTNGMGDTITSKLLAAKRPRLVPITDRVVKETLGWDNYWRGFRIALSTPSVRTTIENATVNAPPYVSLLRRTDVVLWMAPRI